MGTQESRARHLTLTPSEVHQLGPHICESFIKNPRVVLQSDVGIVFKDNKNVIIKKRRVIFVLLAVEMIVNIITAPAQIFTPELITLTE